MWTFDRYLSKPQRVPTREQWINVDPGTGRVGSSSESSVGILEIQFALIGLLGDNSFVSSMTLTCFRVSLGLHRAPVSKSVSTRNQSPQRNPTAYKRLLAGQGHHTPTKWSCKGMMGSLEKCNGDWETFQGRETTFNAWREIPVAAQDVWLAWHNMAGPQPFSTWDMYYRPKMLNANIDSDSSKAFRYLFWIMWYSSKLMLRHLCVPNQCLSVGTRSIFPGKHSSQ